MLVIHTLVSFQGYPYNARRCNSGYRSHCRSHGLKSQHCYAMMICTLAEHGFPSVISVIGKITLNLEKGSKLGVLYQYLYLRGICPAGRDICVQDFVKY